MTVLLPQELIRKKRDGDFLTQAELQIFFSGYMQGQVADYQVAALLMAIFHNSMTPVECAALTHIMRDSGQTLKWTGPQNSIADKHSTGGVGDKTSLILLPLCILEGLRVPMISGRGLGHTGGTLDKLESIPGMCVQIDLPRARKVFEEHGGVFMGQTENLCPLDKRLYAMRDVTATIESIPLITASILSKKLAEGIGTLCMDIKTGSGAFMADVDDARQLAYSIVRVGADCGLRVSCLITDMNSPLGETGGNLLEVAECVDVLQGDGPASTRELSIALAARMIGVAFPERDQMQTRQRLEQHLQSGKAWEKFLEITIAQGADPNWPQRLKTLCQTQFQRKVSPSTQGWVESIDTRALGIAIQILGGGRRLMADAIDPAVGLGSLKRQGDRVEKDEPVAVIYANDSARLEQAEKVIASAYKMTSVRPGASALILETIDGPQVVS